MIIAVIANAQEANWLILNYSIADSSSIDVAQSVFIWSSIEYALYYLSVVSHCDSQGTLESSKRSPKTRCALVNEREARVRLSRVVLRAGFL